MRNPFTRDRGRDVASFPRNRVLHDVDPADLEEAADALRERTMTLEPDEVVPSRWLIGSVVVVAGGVAAATVIFGREIRSLLGFD